MRGALPLVLLVVAAGCVAPAALRPAAEAACVEPHPCGPHWPEGLTGPFALRDILHERVPVNGVVLDGDVYLPDVPAGTRVPVVLWAHPYFGQTYPDASSEDVREGAHGLPVARLVAEGYAVAAFNVRGSGASSGCFEMFGPNEGDDLALLVGWLAEQPWSNGRVGMAGLSYHGTTPWMAAIRQPPALKTIVVAGMVSDLYTFYHTPQGAVFTIGAPFQAAFDALVSLAPPVRGLPDGRPDPAVVPDRACPEVVRTFASLAAGTATDERDAAYWDARRILDGFPNVTAAVYLTHGFQDQWGSGHQQQEDVVWPALDRAPKRMLLGQWAHEFPDRNSHRLDLAVRDWEDRLVAWLDHWLKG
ncbi:MAG TPA: CocE/NonD family hydrolase, partial [Candidatus Thermoplasmatota archaeon]|nr:CocE/NonD family hydrolase [Candidatus Thermoplasmatota archaeon]